jgi:rubrerythrin
VTTVQQSFEKLISIAVTREEEAYEFYIEASKQAELKSSTKLLEELAQQEIGHKKKLLAALDSEVCSTFTCKSIEEFEEMDLSKYLLEIPLDSSSGPQDILIIAIKREEAANNFYKALSELTTSASHRSVFETLAGEEKVHKERLERIYDEQFQPDM